jgi:hypothetical protein
MSIAESLTQKWLRQNIHPYPHKDRVYSDVDAVLSRFPTLRPKTDVYSSVMLVSCHFAEILPTLPSL